MPKPAMGFTLDREDFDPEAYCHGLSPLSFDMGGESDEEEVDEEEED